MCRSQAQVPLLSLSRPGAHVHYGCLEFRMKDPCGSCRKTRVHKLSQCILAQTHADCGMTHITTAVEPSSEGLGNLTFFVIVVIVKAGSSRLLWLVGLASP